MPRCTVVLLSLMLSDETGVPNVLDDHETLLEAEKLFSGGGYPA